ncbi:hypothetical protein Save01_07039 [Streptomyces avermitilis]|uniref:Uncharacterized protein n=2 Tax=Streptomyces avermitilis TaxID=33903 RepID=A0A143SZF2_STRAW|nr:hypothetical protein SAVERM_2p056 [Streptomyces avermitilis MA-4680 = NBRC 14893]BBJ56283.1 hypothetical protein SAVMC3_89120 [Streptomyces avermitilis]GDY70169.1 hypothetical protein SAV14893_095620 [Streptomyces avermitilis]GDY80467.1 hypothetical protein SAV31267_099520 [Streptomyces avermitilis]
MARAVNPSHLTTPAEAFREFQYPTAPLAIYPTDAIEAHRAFIARRRSLRPSEEYRTPTNEEWDAFLAHFEKRKLSLGTCARAFGTSCIHEHACFSEPVTTVR